MLTRFRVGEREDGFTLIELLTVILIIGILAAIAMPIFLKQRQRAVDSSLKSDLRNTANFMETYYVDHAVYPTLMSDLDPDDNLKFGDKNVIEIVTSGSAAGTYCLRGTNTGASNDMYYDSDRGGMQRPGVVCS